jgi:hypothetical protein
MGNIDAAIIAAILGPIAAAIIAMLISKVGISEKLKEVDYYFKRTELIEKILSLRAAHYESQSFDAIPIVDELNEIAAYVRQTSFKQQDYERLSYFEQPRWKQLITLPKPRTIGGWIGSITFYLYSFASFGYLYIATGNVPINRAESPSGVPDDTAPDFILMGLGGFAGSVLIAWLGRKYAIKSARDAATVEWAKRQLARSPEIQ